MAVNFKDLVTLIESRVKPGIGRTRLLQVSLSRSSHSRQTVSRHIHATVSHIETVVNCDTTHLVNLAFSSGSLKILKQKFYDATNSTSGSSVMYFVENKLIELI